MILAATICSAFALVSVLVGVYCLFHYGLFAGDDHPTWLDHAQAAMLSCAVFSFLTMILVILL